MHVHDLQSCSTGDFRSIIFHIVVQNFSTLDHTTLLLQINGHRQTYKQAGGLSLQQENFYFLRLKTDCVISQEKNITLPSRHTESLCFVLHVRARTRMSAQTNVYTQNNLTVLIFLQINYYTLTCRTHENILEFGSLYALTCTRDHARVTPKISGRTVGSLLFDLP